MHVVRNIIRGLGLGLLLLAPPAHASCSKTIEFGVIHWPPYIVWDKEEQASGLDMELIKHVFNEAGCNYAITKLPFKRTIRDIEFGQIDGSPLVSYTQERASFGLYSVPVRPEIIGAFALASRTDTNLPDSFARLETSGLTMGVVLGGWYGPAFQKALNDNPDFAARVRSFENFETLFRSLKAGLIDVAINDIAGGRYIAETTLGGREVTLLPFAVNVNEVHLFFSRKTMTEADVETINAAINAFRATPEYQALISRFLPLELLQHYGFDGK